MDEAEESQVLNNIKEDIQYKDSIHLRQDFSEAGENIEKV